MSGPHFLFDFVQPNAPFGQTFELLSPVGTSSLDETLEGSLFRWPTMDNPREQIRSFPLADF